MKRFTKLLSLFLLSLVGMTNAVAQDYMQGDLIETVEDVLNKEILLYSPGTSGDHPAGFMRGALNFVKDGNIANDCVVKLVPVNQTTADGYDLYVLQQVSTGEYLMDPDATTEEVEEVMMTKDLAKAFKMTVMTFEDVTGTENPEQTRNSATDAKQDLGMTGFVLTRDAVYADGDEAGMYMYVGGLSRPFYSPYLDTNVWQAYVANKITGAEKLNNYISWYFSNGMEDYPAGTAPGCYKPEVVEAAAKTLKAAEKANSGSVSDAEIDQHCANLKAAYEALQEALIPLTEGYYFINNDSHRYFSTETKSDIEFLWAKGGYTAPESGAFSADDVKQIWYVAPGDTITHFYVQNLYSKNYINGESNAAVKVDGDAAYTLGEKGMIGIALEGQSSKGTFVFYEINENNFNDHNAQFHAKFDNNGVMTWKEVTSPNNCFHFTPVSEEDVKAVLAAAEQARRNEVLSASYEKALSVYNSGFAYAGAPVDTLFNHENALVKDASQFFSDSQDPQEGSFDALLDGSFTTFFHSDWHNPNVVEFHSIGVELNSAVEKAIQVKMSKRLNANKGYAIDYPVILDIYASNDTVGNKWTKVAAGVNVDWSTTRSYNDVEYPGTVGYATASYDGAYRFFKFVVKKTDRGNKFFALSAMNVYQGVEDTEKSTISQVSEATRQLMETELANAKKVIEAGNATDKDIESLEAAYDKFVQELPVPALLTDAIKEAQKLSDKMMEENYINEGIGYFSQESLDALSAAIEAAENFNTVGATAPAINGEVAKLEAAVATFKSSVQLPTVGKYYEFRGMSTKKTGDRLTSYRALVYSNNNTLNGGVFFTLPDGADAGIADEAELKDTVQANDNMKYLWMVEKAEAGKLVVRNVGTGMYFAPQNGEIHQSTTPFEIPLLLGAPGTFVFDAGEGFQANASAGGAVVTWADANDPNAWWTFEEVNQDDLSNYSSYWPVASNTYQIMTLPYAITESFTGTIYDLIGVTTDNKLALAENTAGVAAATPFIYIATDALAAGKYATFDHAFVDDAPLSEGGSIEYAFEPVHVEGMTGTVCENDTVGLGLAYLNAGKVTATGKNTTIGVNSGYFDATHKQGIDPADADATLELGKVEITGINDANVVVVPSVVDVYSIDGALIRKNVKAAQATKGLPAGLYIVGGQKMIVK